MPHRIVKSCPGSPDDVTRVTTNVSIRLDVVTGCEQHVVEYNIVERHNLLWHCCCEYSSDIRGRIAGVSNDIQSDQYVRIVVSVTRTSRYTGTQRAGQAHRYAQIFKRLRIGL